MIHFVMPPDGLDSSKFEELFRPQAESLQRRGFSVSRVQDEVFQDGSALRGIPAGATVAYRGWMVKPHEYGRFGDSVRDAGASVLTDSAAYRLAHHLPNWYPSLSEFTAETVFLDAGIDLPAALSRIGWGQFFLKDYVKSLKVSGGSIVRDPADGARWLREMLHYRDELEGGICFRRVENLVAESECRYFVLNQTACGPDDRPIPQLVLAAATRIASPFFSVDVSLNESGDWRIVELGDGQVSDLVGWTAERFADIWARSGICPHT